MPGFEDTEPEPSKAETKPEADLQFPSTPNAPDQIRTDDGAPEPSPAWEKISTQMERFSGLSSDISAIMSELSQEMMKAMDQLHSVRAEVDLKKRELKTLRDIEKSAEELQRVIKNRRLQIADMDRHLERQRADFENEKARREEEDKKYQEDLKARREHDETEYQEKWAAERLRAEQALEDELRALREESMEKQEALNKDLQEREQRIRRQESELDLFTQELEQFMSRLAGRAQSNPDAQEDSPDSRPPLA
jgi:chromosome segregation ATPase